ncbi:MAG: hypothetical protein PHY31_03495 [Smithellaceae bacterium]|nr:hypothetical protein [Smithellaceae bacterium]
MKIAEVPLHTVPGKPETEKYTFFDSSAVGGRDYGYQIVICDDRGVCGEPLSVAPTVEKK